MYLYLRLTFTFLSIFCGDTRWNSWWQVGLVRWLLAWGTLTTTQGMREGIRISGGKDEVDVTGYDQVIVSYWLIGCVASFKKPTLACHNNVIIRRLVQFNDMGLIRTILQKWWPIEKKKLRNLFEIFPKRKPNKNEIKSTVIE